MTASSTGTGRDGQGTSMLTYGLLFGPALGLLVALVFLDGSDLAWGLVIGAAAGVLVGVMLDAEHERRSRTGH